MNPRERTIAYAVLAAVMLAGGAFLFHQFYLAPLHDKEQTLERTREALKTRNERIKKVKEQEPQLAEWRRLSLPNAVDLCLNDYDEYLRKMLTNSGLREPKVKGEQATLARTALQPIKNEAFFRPLNFTMTGHGDLTNVVKLLEAFYSAPLLHKIKNLTIKRHNSGTANPGLAAKIREAREVDIELQVEAIIVTGAENRAELLPIEKVEPHNLAIPRRDYLLIAAKNPFYGPPPPPTTRDEGPDPARSLKLTMIWRGERGWEAELVNSDDNKVMWWLRPEEGYVLFMVKNRVGMLKVMGEVLRIEAQNLFFRAGDKHYRMDVGQTLAEAMQRPLSDAQVKALRLGQAADEQGEGKPASVVEGHPREFPGVRRVSTP
jgi:hypothetical protein